MGQMCGLICCFTAVLVPLFFVVTMHQGNPQVAQSYVEKLTGDKGALPQAARQGEAALGDVVGRGLRLGDSLARAGSALATSLASSSGGGGQEGDFGGQDASEDDLSRINQILDKQEEEEKKDDAEGGAEGEEAKDPDLVEWSAGAAKGPGGGDVDLTLSSKVLVDGEVGGGSDPGGKGGDGDGGGGGGGEGGATKGSRRRSRRAARKESKDKGGDKATTDKDGTANIAVPVTAKKKKEKTSTPHPTGWVPKAIRGGYSPKNHRLAVTGPGGGVAGGFHNAKIRKVIMAKRKGTSCDKTSQCAGSQVCVRGGSSRRGTGSRRGKGGGGKGTCECPIMFAGDDKCSSRPKNMPRWCAMHMRDNMLDQMAKRKGHALSGNRLTASGKDLPGMADWGSCAVVGSSAGMPRGQGTKIDRASAVIRMNDAPTSGYQGLVGSKTTMRIQNIDFCGFTEKNGELCLHYSQEEGNREKQCKRQWWKAGGCNVVRPTRRVIDYVHWYWGLARPPGTGAGATNKLSAGFFGVVLALHLCGEVDIYGMTQTQTHYYTKRRKNTGGRGGVHKVKFGSRHSWDLERRCLQYLAGGNVPGVRVHR